MSRMVAATDAGDSPIRIPEFSCLYVLHKFVDRLQHRRGILLTAEEPLLVLHVKLPDVRIPEILFVALEILFTHPVRVDEVDLRVLHMDVVLKPGAQVRVILVF